MTSDIIGAVLSILIGPILLGAVLLGVRIHQRVTCRMHIWRTASARRGGGRCVHCGKHAVAWSRRARLRLFLWWHGEWRYR